MVIDESPHGSLDVSEGDAPTHSRAALQPLGFSGWIFIVGAVAAVALSIAGLFYGGIGWDSRFDTDATAIARSLDVESLEQAYEAVPVTTEFYGLLVYQLADLGHMLVTGETELFGPDDPEAYFWQGLVTIFFSVLAAISFAWAMSIVTGKRLIGAIGAALLLSTPLWLGSSTVNYKDMPVAAGITVFSSALAVGIAGRMDRSRWVAVLLWASIGASMACATRAGSFVVLLAIALGSLVFVVLTRHRDRQSWLPVAVTGLFGLGTSLLFLLTTNPIARLGPVQWLRDSWAYSTGGFPWVTAMRTAGVDVPSNAITWWYIPAWVLAQLPLVTIAFASVGIGILIRDVLRSRGIALTRDYAWFVPFAIQGFVLPFGLIVRGTELYDGIRHLLFIFSAFVALALIPIMTVLRKQQYRSTSGRSIAVALGVIVVGASLFASARWFPYSYAFINPVAGWNKAERNWELDYWGVSAREGIRTLNDLGVPPRAVIPYNDPVRPFDPTVTQMPGDNPSGQPFGYYWFARWEFPADVPFECEDLFEIRRDGHLIGKGGVCR